MMLRLEPRGGALHASERLLKIGLTHQVPFDELPLAILLNLLVVVAHSADMPQLLLPWLPYGTS